MGPEVSERRLFSITHLISYFSLLVGILAKEGEGGSGIQMNTLSHSHYLPCPHPLLSHPVFLFLRPSAVPSLLHSCQTGNRINCVHMHSCNSCQVGSRDECSQPGDTVRKQFSDLQLPQNYQGDVFKSRFPSFASIPTPRFGFSRAAPEQVLFFF